jgi:hypothetical protein
MIKNALRNFVLMFLQGIYENSLEVYEMFSFLDMLLCMCFSYRMCFAYMF